MNEGSRAKASDLLQTLVGASLVLVAVGMLCWTPPVLVGAAAAANAPPVAAVFEGQRPANQTTTMTVGHRCLPVAHDVLWKRLRLVVADLDNFRTTDDDNNDQSASTIGNTSAVASESNDTSLELKTLSAGGTPDQHEKIPDRPSTDSAAAAAALAPSPGPSEPKLPGTLPSEESNRIPDEATTPRSPARGPPPGDLHPRLDRLQPEERKVRRLRRNKRLRRRKLMTSIFRKTSWHCHMSKYWKRMPPGFFPPYVQTARCRQHTCMLGMFECRPRRYRIKLLRRNDGVCNPLPTTTSRTDYEETWTFVEFKVVVGCECSRKYAAGSYSRLDRSTAETGRHLRDSNNS